MQHIEFEPPDALSHCIKSFWYNRGEFGAAEGAFEVIPDGYAEIIFYFGSSCRIQQNGAMITLPSPFLTGLLNRPAVFYLKERFEVIGIRCYPWMVFDLLGIPPGNDGVRTFEHPVTRLQPVLAEHITAGRVEEAIAEVTAYFLEAVTIAGNDSTLLKAGAAMSKTNGTLQVSQVAAAAHATVRTLERKFKQAAGHTVKDVSALMRFEQVRNRLWLQPDAGLAALAHEMGYTDQAHLSREFKRFSGTTPAAFARRAKQDKPAAADDFVAFIQS